MPRSSAGSTWCSSSSSARPCASACARRCARTPDIERALPRLSVGRGGPRDLAALRDGLDSAEALAATLEAEPEALAPPPAPLAEIVVACSNHRPLIGALGEALADEPPLFARDGGFIRQGYRAELDEQRTLRDDSRKTVAALEAKYRAVDRRRRRSRSGTTT